MKNISTLTLLVLLFSASSSFAQQQVVVVDMGKIFREHISFKSQIAALQKEVEGFKLSIQADRTKIQSESEALSAIDKSSSSSSLLVDKFLPKRASSTKSLDCKRSR